MKVFCFVLNNAHFLIYLHQINVICLINAYINSNKATDSHIINLSKLNMKSVTTADNTETYDKYNSTKN